MTLGALLAIYLVQLAAAISPGPAILMAARTGLREGFARGAWLSVGIGLGACFWAAAALFGLSVLFKLAPSLLTALKLAGAAYLVWMAVKLWRHADEPLAAGPVRTPRSAGSAFRLGLMTQLANPKPAVMFSAIFVGTVPPGTPLVVLIALLTVVFLNETLWNILVARIFSLDRTRAGYLRLKGGIDRTFGGLLAILGVKIAVT